MKTHTLLRYFKPVITTALFTLLITLSTEAQRKERQVPQKQPAMQQPAQNRPQQAPGQNAERPQRVIQAKPDMPQQQPAQKPIQREERVKRNVEQPKMNNTNNEKRFNTDKPQANQQKPVVQQPKPVRDDEVQPGKKKEMDEKLRVYNDQKNNNNDNKQKPVNTNPQNNTAAQESRVPGQNPAARVDTRKPTPAVSNTIVTVNNTCITPVYQARNPSWRYRDLPRRNTTVTYVPAGYRTYNYNNFNYRYYNGIFYRPYSSSWMVVSAPFGFYVDVLPFGYREIYVNSRPYYYYYGTYYDYRDSYYYVVSPPVGAIVESLPEGYEVITIDGETYYEADGAQYKPVLMENGEIWYQGIKAN